MNVRTIRELRNRAEVADNFSTCKIDIGLLGLQEHRIVHTEPVRYERVLGNTLVATSAIKNSAGAAIGGVGLLLSPRPGI